MMIELDSCSVHGVIIRYLFDTYYSTHEYYKCLVQVK